MNDLGTSIILHSFCSRIRRQWLVKFSVRISGTALKTYYRARQRIVALPQRIIDFFLEAVLWIARTGSPWRDMPEEFGHWHRVYVRYNRWSKKGVWEEIFEALSADKDLEYLMVDGSIARVHQHGAPKKTHEMRNASVSPEGD